MAEDDRKIADARKDWEERKLNPSLKRGAERKAKFVTSSGIDVKRAYDPEDLHDFDFVNDLGFPGEYPFTRGVQPTMYRGRLWTMRQYAGFGSAE
jgi:methylmalonyl-CoA mutase N-terminal domain/subunit